VKVPKEIQEALDATGLPWEVISGSRHFKIVLAGRMVGILGRRCVNVGRAEANTVAQIRRAARAVQEAVS
jgi:hypothetical protein